MSRRDDRREQIKLIADRAPKSMYGVNVSVFGLERAVDAEIIWDAYLDLMQSHGFRLASWNSYPEIKARIVAARVSLLDVSQAIQSVVNDREARS